MVNEKREVEFLAKTIFGEARGCSTDNQRAVGYSILNRRDQNDSRWGGGTVEGVVTQPYQYECWNGGPKAIDADIAREPGTYRTIHGLAQGVYNGKEANPIYNHRNPCCYYNNPTKEDPAWARNMLAKGVDYKDIDKGDPNKHHRFYYWSKYEAP